MCCERYNIICIFLDKSTWDSNFPAPPYFPASHPILQSRVLLVNRTVPISYHRQHSRGSVPLQGNIENLSGTRYCKTAHYGENEVFWKRATMKQLKTFYSGCTVQCTSTVPISIICLLDRGRCNVDHVLMRRRRRAVLKQGGKRGRGLGRLRRRVVGDENCRERSGSRYLRT